MRIDDTNAQPALEKYKAAAHDNLADFRGGMQPESKGGGGIKYRSTDAPICTAPGLLPDCTVAASGKPEPSGTHMDKDSIHKSVQQAAKLTHPTESKAHIDPADKNWFEIILNPFEGS